MSLFKTIATCRIAAITPLGCLLVSATLSAATASCQQQKIAPGSAPIVQPGAPGQSSKILPPTTTPTPLRTPSDADIAFMRGMIMHHGQAVEMTALMGSRTHNQDLLALGKRISISQTDEMGFMKRWLEERGIPLSDRAGMDPMAGMAGMEHMGHMEPVEMRSMPAMPGMLTAQHMDALG